MIDTETYNRGIIMNDISIVCYFINRRQDASLVTSAKIKKNIYINIYNMYRILKKKNERKLTV